MDYHVYGFEFFLNISGIEGFEFFINITIAAVFETSGYKMCGGKCRRCYKSLTLYSLIILTFKKSWNPVCAELVKTNAIPL